ncbi:uncharacterized protein LOC129722421 [Wyeomyia smithii]|uniref:uncharacterized protein LOC129722421 n=1 Tax=Wyeomyia smithii TaxID=174621 RepID=UPI002467AEF1|nr:uncharacterized protein LOC129722421 [Wyeomyia smithii]
MKEFFIILPLILSVGGFLFDEGIPDSRCPLQDNPMNPTHLPHPTECGRFYKCFSGRAFLISCPLGQEFGAQIQRCDYPSFARCRTALAEPEPAEFHLNEGFSDTRCSISVDQMNPVHLPHPTNCQKFLKCANGRGFEIDCPIGQEWAASLNRCDFPSVAKCSLSKPFHANDIDMEEEVQDELIEAVPVKAEFVYSAGIPDARCPRYDDPFRPIHLPHADCSKFQKCFDGRAYVLDCPPGQQFGVKINRCDFPQFAQCAQFKRKSLSKRLDDSMDDEYDYSYEEFPLDSKEWTEEQREMVVGVIDIRCPLIDDVDDPVHLTHPRDCEKFYKCYGGRAYLINCPLGQHWSVRFNRCDYPKVAKCSIRH